MPVPGAPTQLCPFFDGFAEPDPWVATDWANVPVNLRGIARSRSIPSRSSGVGATDVQDLGIPVGAVVGDPAGSQRFKDLLSGC